MASRSSGRSGRVAPLVLLSVALGARGLLGAEFIRALLKAKRAFPGKAWYVVIDEDASVMLANLLCVLGPKHGARALPFSLDEVGVAGHT